MIVLKQDLLCFLALHVVCAAIHAEVVIELITTELVVAVLSNLVLLKNQAKDTILLRIFVQVWLIWERGDTT